MKKLLFVIDSLNCGGAKEQLLETECGLVSEIDENDLYIKIKEILDNNKLREQIQSNLRNHISDTSKEIDKLYKVIND